jgi:hypothetical protein
MDAWLAVVRPRERRQARLPPGAAGRRGGRLAAGDVVALDEHPIHDDVGAGHATGHGGRVRAGSGVGDGAGDLHDAFPEGARAYIEVPGLGVLPERPVDRPLDLLGRRHGLRASTLQPLHRAGHPARIHLREELAEGHPGDEPKSQPRDRGDRDPQPVAAFALDRNEASAP